MGTPARRKSGRGLLVRPQSFPGASALLLAGCRWRTRCDASRRSREENPQPPQRTFAPGAAMILPYLSRLLCLCFASFFVLNLGAGLLVRVFSKSAIRFAESRTAGAAAGFLLSLRLLPYEIGRASC